jgi:hypothetical protein
MYGLPRAGPPLCANASFRGYSPDGQEARRIPEGVKEAVNGVPTACPILLPLWDEFRTFCYECRIEEMPALLADEVGNPRDPRVGNIMTLHIARLLDNSE